MTAAPTGAAARMSFQPWPSRRNEKRPAPARTEKATVEMTGIGVPTRIGKISECKARHSRAEKPGVSSPRNVAAQNCCMNALVATGRYRPK